MSRIHILSRPLYVERSNKLLRFVGRVTDCVPSVSVWVDTSQRVLLTGNTESVPDRHVILPRDSVCLPPKRETRDHIET